MAKRYLLTIIRETSKGKLLYLLILLLLYLALVPFVDRFIKIQFLFNLFMSVILVAAIYAVSQDQRLDLYLRKFFYGSVFLLQHHPTLNVYI
jgi:hypothetical protein